MTFAEQIDTNFLHGLKKTLPYALLYDEVGSVLFEKITQLQEYYPTREETKLLEQHKGDIVRSFPRNAVIVELGAGSSTKTRILLEEFQRVYGETLFVPVDISEKALKLTRESLADLIEEDSFEVAPICADYFEGIAQVHRQYGKTRPIVLFWLGSSIGNMVLDEAAEFLQRIEATLHPAFLLIGMDVWKDPSILYAAYHDKEGVTEQFIRNILKHINAEYVADFSSEQFDYEVVVNDVHHRVEMYLTSKATQTVHMTLDSMRDSVTIPAGTRILVEYSHKYTQEERRQVARNTLQLLHSFYSDMFSLNLYSSASSASC